MEQASIWCFFSIAQISVMLFLIRKTLVEGNGKGSKSVTSNEQSASNPQSPSKGEFSKGQE